MISGGLWLCRQIWLNIATKLLKTESFYRWFVSRARSETWLSATQMQLRGNKRHLVKIRDSFYQGGFSGSSQDHDQEPFLVEGNIQCRVDQWSDVFHLLPLLEAGAMIDGDPMKVATDLAIDAGIFTGLPRPNQKEYYIRVQALPTQLANRRNNTTQLRESDIDFANMGQPDMTYSWTKLTGVV